MKRLLVCLALILSFVCMPIGNQNSFGATKTKAQSKFVSNKVLKKWKKGWHSRSGRKYYCVKKGKLAKGWKKIGKNKFYFDIQKTNIHLYLLNSSDAINIKVVHK